jgi:hypothetical protein
MGMAFGNTFGRSLLRGCRFAAGALIAACAALSAQEVMPSDGGVASLSASDAAILEARETRKDIACTVTPDKPALGFDFKFHTGYDVAISLKDLAGQDNLLTMVFRVTPEGRPDEAAYFSQRTEVPKIDENAKGDAVLPGSFDVGEGKYHVSWLMRDRAGRVCSFDWDIEASLPSRDRQMTLDIPAAAVRAAEKEPFKPEPPVEREPRGGPLSIKVIVNFAPQDPTSAALQPLDTGALVSILRSMAREPRIGKFSVVAFNMQEQRVIYRQQEASQIDFPSLGAALKTLNLGTVNVKQLARKHADSEFLSGLMTREIKEEKEDPDAVIIAGPKVTFDDSGSPDAWKQLGHVKAPVFCMNFNLDPQANPGRDAIGGALRSLKGAEFAISRPRDLFFAWTEIMSRIVKSKFGRTAGVAPASQ